MDSIRNVFNDGKFQGVPPINPRWSRILQIVKRTLLSLRYVPLSHEVILTSVFLPRPFHLNFRRGFRRVFLPMILHQRKICQFFTHKIHTQLPMLLRRAVFSTFIRRQFSIVATSRSLRLLATLSIPNPIVKVIIIIYLSFC